MSWYTVFDTLEPLITSTTTAAILASTDAVLVHNISANKKFQSTPGAMGTMSTITTATSTGTNLTNYGLTFLQLGTAGTTVAWIIADPTAKGLVKSVYVSSTTSTNNVFTVASTAVTTILTSAIAASPQATAITVQGAGGGYFQLTSVSTTQWVLTGKYGTIATS